MIVTYAERIELRRRASRRLTARAADPCPVCGCCDMDWKWQCIHSDWCPYRQGDGNEMAGGGGGDGVPGDAGV